MQEASGAQTYTQPDLLQTRPERTGPQQRILVVTMLELLYRYNTSRLHEVC